LSQNRTVLCLQGAALYWCLPGSAIPEPVDEEKTKERLDAQLSQRDHRVVFAAPGADVRLTDLPVAREERRHLDNSLPFMLEESLTDELEDLHFARLPIAADRFAVAVTAHECMSVWRKALGDCWDKVPWVPEPLLLPWNEDTWTLVFDGDDVVLRSGAAAGARIERGLLEPLVDGLLAAETPKQIVLYGQDEEQDLATLPEVVRPLCSWRRGGLSAALLVADSDQPLLDLRQGSYAPQLPYVRWWRQGRSLAALLLIALLIHLLSGWTDLMQLERDNLALRTEIQAVYREVNPRGQVPDAERQLRRQVATLRGGDGGASFTGLLAPLGQAVAAVDGVILASLNYSQRNGELRLNLLAPDFAAVETLRQQLVDGGLRASLESSSRSGDRVRARLRIGGSS